MKLKLYIILLAIVTSCYQRQGRVMREPFEINSYLTCQDLINNGYKWIPGVDVILLGKKSEDTLDYYQLSYSYSCEYLEEMLEMLEEEPKKDTLEDLKAIEYKLQYEDVDPLDLPDSVYHRIWGGISSGDICKDATIIWRYYRQQLKQNEISGFRSKIDRNKYAVISRSPSENNESFEQFKVINLNTKDTFDCEIFEEENLWYFASAIDIKKEN